jgi:hypothetical protein
VSKFDEIYSKCKAEVEIPTSTTTEPTTTEETTTEEGSGFSEFSELSDSYIQVE